MSEPTRHHYIPIFYLRQWAGPDGKLCEYSRPSAETKAKRHLGNTKHSMLTSDRPVIMTNGLVQADAHLAIPLSPKLLFLATKTDETHRAISSMSSNEIVEVVNHKVSEQAVKYVYGIDDRQIRFVANRLGRMAPSTPLG